MARRDGFFWRWVFRFKNLFRVVLLMLVFSAWLACLYFAIDSFNSGVSSLQFNSFLNTGSLNASSLSGDVFMIREYYSMLVKYWVATDLAWLRFCISIAFLMVFFLLGVLLISGISVLRSDYYMDYYDEKLRNAFMNKKDGGDMDACRGKGLDLEV